MFWNSEHTRCIWSRKVPFTCDVAVITELQFRLWQCIQLISVNPYSSILVPSLHYMDKTLSSYHRDWICLYPAIILKQL